MSNYKKNVTMIDDLPFLDDLENNGNGLSMIPPDNSTQVQKFIRQTNTHKSPYESGMNVSSSYKQEPIIDDPSMYNQPPQMQSHPQQMTDNYVYQQHQQQQHQPQSHYHPRYDYNEPSCIQVAEHVMNCMVCSKLYQNHYTIYNVVIILLAIICILLLKRVLNV